MNREKLELPKHCDRILPNRTAHAPYNFVPLPECVVTAVDKAEQLPAHDTYSNQGYTNTGYFDVELKTKTPLYVRCPMTRQQFDNQETKKYADGTNLPNNDNPEFRKLVKNLPEFFYTRDPQQPVIPGSSLRGMLRSIFEIVTWSKVQAVNSNQIFYRAVADSQTSLGTDYQGRMQQIISGGYCPKVKAGYLLRSGNDYSITPAQEVKKVQYFRVEEADAIRVIKDLDKMRHVRYSKDRYELNPDYKWMRREVWFQSVAPKTSPKFYHSQLMYYGRVVTLQENQPSNTSGWLKGVFIASGWILGKRPRPGQPQNQWKKGKHLHWIINPKSSSLPIKVDEEDILAYRDGGGLTEDIKKNGLNVLPADGQETACFYLEWKDNREKDRISFGHTPFFRLPYEKTPFDFVPEELRVTKEIDFTEAVFGFTKKEGTERERAYSGKVFVTDAVLYPSHQNNIFADIIVPKILASPKPTCFQHYLVQERPNDKRDLKHYGSKPLEDTVIRGYKRYWHRKEITFDDIKERNSAHLEDGEVKKRSTQHTQFKPVNENVTFRFRVYFENLSDVELGALCWVLHPLGEAPSANQYIHSLGMGKPLGMGAVELRAKLSLTNRAERYKGLFEDDDWKTGVSQIQDLSDLETLKKLVKLFEQFILKEIDEEGKEYLSQVDRIKALLRLMRYPGPSKSATSYMTIEPTNEYKERLVLPDPFGIDLSSSNSSPTAPQNNPLTKPTSPASHTFKTKVIRPSKPLDENKT